MKQKKPALLKPPENKIVWLVNTQSACDEITVEPADDSPYMGVTVRCTNRYKLPGAIIEALARLERMGY